MALVASELVFADQVNWKNNNLYDFTYPFNVPAGWEEFFEQNKGLVEKISNELQKDSANIYPELPNVFNAMFMTSFDSVRCVILAQDPYHGKGVAYGLTFSSCPNAPVPASLRNIFKKLRQEGFTTSTGYLGKWAQQGVLLINTALTVRESSPGSHLGLWKDFSYKLMEYIGKKEKISWILWGQKAHLFQGFVNKNSLLLKGAHPSPVNTSGGFLEYDYFRPTNEYLKKNGKNPIDWNL